MRRQPFEDRIVRNWLAVRLPKSTIAAYMLSVIVSLFLGETNLSLPAVLGGGTNVVVGMSFLSVIVGSATAWAFHTRGNQLEARGNRRLGRLDALLFIGLLATVSMLLGAAAALSGGSWVRASSVAAIATSIGAAGAVISDGYRGAMMVLALFLGTASYGPRLPAASYIRIMQADSRPAFVACVAVASAAVAVCVVARWPSPSAAFTNRQSH